MRGERGDGGKEGGGERREINRGQRCRENRNDVSPWFQVLPAAGFCRDIPISS